MASRDSMITDSAAGDAGNLDPLPKMRIALTGGAGRVGTGLRDALAGQVESIRIIDRADPGNLRPTESWVEADISNLDALVESFAHVDAIVHLAGYPNERGIEDILQGNVLGTHNVLEAARRTGTGRVVFGSSNHVMG